MTRFGVSTPATPIMLLPGGQDRPPAYILLESESTAAFPRATARPGSTEATHPPGTLPLPGNATASPRRAGTPATHGCLAGARRGHVEILKPVAA